MTDNIEQKALAPVNKVGVYYYPSLGSASMRDLRTALCRAIEQQEAFRQEVSDAIQSCMLGPVAEERLSPFIIPKPVDPFLIEAREVCARVEEERNNPVWATRYRSGQYDEHIGWVKHIRAALAARGLEIREKQP